MHFLAVCAYIQYVCVSPRVCMHVWKLKTAQVRGQRSPTLYNMLPKPLSAHLSLRPVLFFGGRSEDIIFSRAATDVRHHAKALHAPKNADLHRSAGKPRPTQTAQSPVKHPLRAHTDL